MASNTPLTIDAIVRVPQLQGRVTHSDDHSSDIAETLKRKGKVPRPKVMRIDDPADALHHGHCYLIDGFHTVDGYEKAGRSMIPVAVAEGTWQDARDAAASANSQHTAL